MKRDTEKLNDTKRKPSGRRYTLAAVFLLLLLTPVFVFMFLKSMPDPDSEKIILEAAAKQLGKDPNKLTNEDFATIEVIDLSGKSLGSIHLLGKFINLRELNMPLNKPSLKTVPKWKKFLSNYGIIHIPTFSSRLGNAGISLGFGDEEVCLIDLSPLKNLHNLENIDLWVLQLDNIKPLAGLTNLKGLNLRMTGISDIKPLRKLKNLEMLDLDYNPITDLEPLKKLTNLKSLNVRHCDNITKEQVDDLRKALPDLKIYYGPAPSEQRLFKKPLE